MMHDFWRFGIDLFPTSAGRVQHDVGKLSKRSTRLL
jgi:hypothetical protein